MQSSWKRAHQRPISYQSSYPRGIYPPISAIPSPSRENTVPTYVLNKLDYIGAQLSALSAQYLAVLDNLDSFRKESRENFTTILEELSPDPNINSGSNTSSIGNETMEKSTDLSPKVDFTPVFTTGKNDGLKKRSMSPSTTKSLQQVHVEDSLLDTYPVKTLKSKEKGKISVKIV